MSAEIVLSNVALSYSTKEMRVDLFSGLNLSIGQGEYVLVLGKSGSGKSTLLNLIAGFVTPDAGSVRVGGMNLAGMSTDQQMQYRNKQIGFVYQAFNLVECFNALENVMAPLLIAGEKKAAAKARAEELLGQVGLSGRAGHMPFQLSGGEQQRVAIARALACDPATILADEPTGNLDEATGDEVLGLIDALHTRGKTVVMVSHDEDIARHATRVVRMGDLC